jgi:pyridoxal/pyridoxine/pyridoxamine kinase
MKPDSENIKQVLEKLHSLGPKIVIITSVELNNELVLFGSMESVKFQIKIPKYSQHFTGVPFFNSDWRSVCSVTNWTYRERCVV